MLQTLGPDGEDELRCGSHVARLLEPKDYAGQKKHNHPSRKDMPSFQASKETVMSNLKTTEKRLSKDPE
ncbi:hypothetical protein DPEC_G00146260 [Dallia pectoralis]|uniref:Uncharacterized protein n=1 Tax=Dallia pectoralis TaxID=75939 RepID=A0ACC2GP33_DALPE|nr:hypothetical protein DPEC_G00146260 [Dallia pectoralis]